MLLRRLRDLRIPGYPLRGTSRKSLVGNVLQLPVDQRSEGTAATVAALYCKVLILCLLRCGGDASCSSYE